MLSSVQLATLLWIFAEDVTADPVAWLTSLGVFAPCAALLWYLYDTTRKDRDRYRDFTFERVTEYRDTLRAAALAQEKLATTVEERILAADEVVKLRRLLERLSRRRAEEG